MVKSQENDLNDLNDYIVTQKSCSNILYAI